MANIYSDNIASIIDDGKIEARRHRSRLVRPEHLLMAMLKKRGTAVDTVIDSLNVNKADVTIECDGEEVVVGGAVEISLDAKKEELT